MTQYAGQAGYGVVRTWVHISSYEYSVVPSDLQIVLEPGQINAANQVTH